MVIELRPVTAENWYDCTLLKVKPEQQSVFPAPVVNWIAEAKFVQEFELLAIYSGAVVVGFIVFCTTPDEEGNCWIPALMIDEHHQGQGYARQAMVKLIQHMRNEGCSRLMIGHRPDNRIAGMLYESLGFQKVSEELYDGEVVRCLELNQCI
ncbi:spermidine acetyltransferase [Paenibacillus sp. FSL R7-0333]|nr:spermidine acetyltransferase [Paenibacillus sp. FSL R7-0333]